MNHPFSTLKTSLAFYLLVLLFPVSIYMSDAMTLETRDDHMQLTALNTVQNMLHHLTHTQPDGLKTAMVSQIDAALSDIANGPVQKLALFEPNLERTYKQLNTCWTDYKLDSSIPPHTCWKHASDAYDVTAHAIAKSQERRLEGLFLTLLASMIIAVALVYIIRNQMKIQLDRHSMFDPVTRLFNRNYFNAEFRKVLSLSNRHGHSLSMLSLSLDEYDAITSGIVSDKGNAILAEFGALIKSLIRESDIACRYDDNLFFIVTPQTDAAQAAILSERLKNKTEETDHLGITVATVQFNGSEDIDAFVNRAKDAIHEA